MIITSLFYCILKYFFITCFLFGSSVVYFFRQLTIFLTYIEVGWTVKNIILCVNDI